MYRPLRKGFRAGADPSRNLGELAFTVPLKAACSVGDATFFTYFSSDRAGEANNG